MFDFPVTKDYHSQIRFQSNLNLNLTSNIEVFYSFNFVWLISTEILSLRRLPVENKMAIVQTTPSVKT